MAQRPKATPSFASLDEEVRFPRRVAEIQAWEAMKHPLALTGEWPSRGPA